MHDLVSESLQIVGEELAVTFNDVRLALEQYSDGESGSRSMDRCLDLLHTAIGVLRITETYGASLLTEEMESTCRHLAQLPRNDGESVEAMEALSRATVQLPAYVERIINGGRDVPLVLLPLLNDLRAARGKPLLSESTLLLLNMSSPSERTAHVGNRQISGEDIRKLCQELRPQFQLALLGWIKGVEFDENLQRIAQVAERMENAAATMEVHQLWWVTGGIVEALLDKGLETSVALKRLFGQIDREMKRLLTVGEARYSQQAPTELINNLLYYIARSTVAGTRVAAVRSAFNLSDLIPGDDQVDKVRESLSAPSAKLMHTVADAIRDDLARVKDVLDIFVRTGMEHAEELGPQIDLLKKIGDTMGVLGLGELRQTIEAKRDELQEIVDSGAQIDETALMDMAAALLSVEDNLDEQLFGLIRPDAEVLGEDADDKDAVDIEYGQVTRAVMRESVVNLARVKDAVTQVLERPGESTLLDSVPQQLRGITAGLMMLEKNVAASVVEEIGKFIGELVQQGRGAVDTRQLDMLADAIVSLEYYIETLEAGRTEPLHMLDNAERCLKFLRDAKKEGVQELLEEEISAAASTDEIPTREPTSIEDLTPPISEIPAFAATEGAEIEQVAPELIELFIDEAREEIESITKQFSAWERDETQQDVLINIRRSFHTLKGSGRMVGAKSTGEFCWSIEDLLNRLLNKTVELVPEMVPFLRRAIAALPEVLEELEVGTQPTTDIKELMKEAAAFAQGTSGISPLSVSEAEAVEETSADEEMVLTTAEGAEWLSEEAPPVDGGDIEPARPELDSILLEILSKETVTHLTVIMKFIEECREGAPPFRVPEDVYRACHTLHGSVTMAKADPAAKISEPLNQLIRHAFDHEVLIGPSVLDVCTETVSAMEDIIQCLSDSERKLPDTSDLETRLWTLGEDIKAEAVVQDAEDRLADTFEPGAGSFVEAGTEPGDLPAEGVEPPIDAEIAATFAEEAAEILEGVDALLARSFDGQMDDATMAELLRYLHTFKGGARLAGLSGMGDLSHELETLLLRITRGELQQNIGWLNLLQETVDDLHRLSEEIANGVVENPSSQVLAKLHEALAAEVDDEIGEIGAEVEVSEQQTEIELATDDEEEVVAATDELSESDFDQPRPLPAADQLGELARELQEPPVPAVGSPGDLDQPPSADLPVPERREFVRIEPALLEQLLNNAGEVSIFHSRLSEQMGQTQFNLEELGQTVSRLRDQLRNLEMTTEAQILYQHQTEVGRDDTVDPLKLERYSKIQQLSRALAETASDVNSIKDLLQNLTSDTEALLVQQARTASELQDGLMRTRMVPFEQYTTKLARLVRQMAAEQGKTAELSLRGGGEIDRQILEKMLPAFEHMLRNAVIHGIESPAEREAAGKPASGSVAINMRREGSQVIIEIADDGRGIDADAIRRKAVELDLAAGATDLKDEEVLRFILQSGFSTADRLTKAAGRGVGMDVVASEIAKLGGALEVDSRKNKGTTFTIRLPFTLAVTQALIVRAAKEYYALPLPTVEGIIRISKAEFDAKMLTDDPTVDYGGQTYRLRHLGQYLGLGPARIPDDQDRIPIILVRAGNNSTALVTDEMLASHEIVVKPIGKQLAAISGLSGATILGDGRIVVILDIGVLIRSAMPRAAPADAARQAETDQLLALVVDDSITMRRVTQRLLERNGMRVVTAKDGLEAIGMLRDHRPDIILLDIEMPRMNGYEFAAHVRSSPETENLPIIMITSRVSDEHRARAIELGVNDFLGKPYQEGALLDAVRNLLEID